jgi:hypothetical protein
VLLRYSGVVRATSLLLLPMLALLDTSRVNLPPATWNHTPARYVHLAQFACAPTSTARRWGVKTQAGGNIPHKLRVFSACRGGGTATHPITACTHHPSTEEGELGMAVELQLSCTIHHLDVRCTHVAIPDTWQFPVSTTTFRRPLISCTRPCDSTKNQPRSLTRLHSCQDNAQHSCCSAASTMDQWRH